MKANELRLGNYIYGISNTIEIVESITKDDIDTDKHFGLPISQVEPIPLTEEWLLKFGFEDWTWCDDCAFTPLFFGDSLYCRFYNKQWHIKRMKVGRDSKGVFGKTEGKYIVPKERIKHVHELQNLYHALTETELEISQ